MATPVPQGANGEPMTDERFKIALGCYDGITPSNHFGSNPDVGTSFEVIREAGGVHTFITTATTLEVTSSSTDDDAGGTGALVVKLVGLDSTYAEVTENVTLDGQTPVLTSNAYLRINSAQVINCGTGKTNAGDIYICDDAGTHTNGVPDDLALCEEKIPVGFALSESTIYTVPLGFTLYISNVEIQAAAGKTVTFQGNIFLPDLGSSGINAVIFEGVAQDTNYKLERGSMPAIAEKTSVWMSAKVGAGSAEVSGAVDGWLVDTDKITRGVGAS